MRDLKYIEPGASKAIVIDWSVLYLGDSSITNVNSFFEIDQYNNFIP